MGVNDLTTGNNNHYMSKPAASQAAKDASTITRPKSPMANDAADKVAKTYTAKLFGALNRFTKSLSHDAAAHPLKSRFGDAYDLLIRADAYRYQQNLTEAIPLYEQALEANPRFAEAAIALAECFNAQGNTDQAIHYYKHHLAHMPFDKIAQRQLGRCYTQHQQYKQAQHHLKRAWQLDPTDLETRFYLALAHEDNNQTTEAIAHYQAILDTDGDFIPAAINLGNVLFRSGDLVRAEATFRNLVNRVPSLTRGHLGLALTLDRLGCGDEALQSYHRVMASAKNNHQVLRQDKAFIQNRIVELTAQWNHHRGRRKAAHLAVVK
jgi:tetratricopeptide (TPR) repeat protein